MDLSIVIVSFNTKNLLKDCLASVFKQTKNVSYEVIVIDNASTDGSVEFIKELTSSRVKELKNSLINNSLIDNKSIIKLIENKKNLGFAKANNQGLQQAQGDYVLLLNSDTVLKNNPLLKLIKFAKNQPKAGVIGCRLLNKDGSYQSSVAPFFTLSRAILWLTTGDRLLYSSPFNSRQVDWVMGAALMVKKKALKKVGWLDEKFFMYLEEQEWCYRFKKADWQVWFYPDAEIFHLVRGSSPEGRQRAILEIYKGLIYFYQKHFPLWQLVVLKLLLQAKALGLWLLGILTNNRYLKETYAKAFKLAR